MRVLGQGRGRSRLRDRDATLKRERKRTRGKNMKKRTSVTDLLKEGRERETQGKDERKGR